MKIKIFVPELYTENDERWDELLKSADGQLALDKLADAAMAEICAGQGASIAFTEEGTLLLVS